MEEFASLPQESARPQRNRHCKMSSVAWKAGFDMPEKKLEALGKNLQSKKREIDHAKKQIRRGAPEDASRTKQAGKD